MKPLSEMSDDELMQAYHGSAAPAAAPSSPLQHMSDEELLKAYQASAPKSKISKTESALRGASQGVTPGFGDEGAGAVESGIGALDALVRGKNNFGDTGHLEGLKNLVENYRRSRDEVRSQNEAAQAANPKTYALGQIVGSIPTAIATSGLGSAAEGAGLAARLANASKVGAVYGAAGGAGASKADLTKGDILGLAKDTGEGAAIGGVTGPVTVLGLEGANALAQPILKSANVSRVAALGGGKAAIKKLLSKNQVQEMGEQMKDDAIMGPFTSRATIQKNLEAAQNAHGQDIGKIISAGDEANAGGIVPADKIAQKAVDEVWTPLAARSTNKKAADTIAQEIQNFEEQHGGTKLSLEDLQKFKNDIENNTKVFQRQGDDATSGGLRGLYNVFNKGGEEAISGLEGTVPEVNLPAFQASKKGYGLTTNALKMVADRNAKEAAGSTFNLPDQIVGGASAIASAAKHTNPLLSLLLGVGGAAVNKGVRGYGNQGAASVKDLLAALLRKPTTPLSNQSAATVKNFLGALKEAPVVNRALSPWAAQQVTQPGGQ